MALEATSTAGSLRSDFLMLLVTELQNQNPLEPMDNSQMTAQMAQLSQLELLENINNTFEKALQAAQLDDATAMLGKEVTFFPAGGLTAASGRVECVRVDDGEVWLQVGSHLVGLDEILSISDQTAN